MIEALLKIGFSQKEAEIYLALLEYGLQPASVIAKKLKMPRPTVLYVLETLTEKAYVHKSKKGRSQYFYTEPKFLKQAKQLELDQQKSCLDSVLPKLEECKHPYSSPPKIQLFDGLDNCRQAYLMLLESQTEIYEFAAHDDLIKMGEEFMEGFMNERARRGIVLHAVCHNTVIHQFNKKRNELHKRTMKIFDPVKGKLYSSIAVFENKVLLLNLYHDAFAILIENSEVAETLRTIHGLVE